MTRFRDVEQACAYVVHNNPTRCKSVNLLERDRHTPTTYAVWLGEEMIDAGPVAVYSAVKARIEDVLKEYKSNSERDARKALVFEHYYLTPRWHQAHADEVAVKLGTSTRTIRRWIAEVRESVERGLLAMGAVSSED